MLSKIVYKIVVFSPYILFAIAIVSLIMSIIKKRKQFNSKKYIITAISSFILGIVIFIIPLIVILVATLT